MYAQSCLILCDAMDSRLPGSSVHGIFQARILGVAISYTRGSSLAKNQSRVSCVSCMAGGFFTTVPPYWVLYIIF